MEAEKAQKLAARFGIDIPAIMQGELKKIIAAHVSDGSVQVKTAGEGRYEILVNIADSSGTALGRNIVTGQLGDLVKEFVKPEAKT